MTDDTRDHTPVSVTLPAYAWGPIREAVERHQRRLVHRSKRRPAPVGSDADLDGLRAKTLEEALPTLYRASPRGRRVVEAYGRD
jgi:hypothetical protein